MCVLIFQTGYVAHPIVYCTKWISNQSSMDIHAYLHAAGLIQGFVLKYDDLWFPHNMFCNHVTRGHLNISFVHMCEQRFSKHTQSRFAPFRKNTLIWQSLFDLHPILPSKQDFLGNMFCGIEDFEKLPKRP